ncbi:MAG TPA: radical SAM protein [Dehalococcoidia bacterium]|nr:radical SAM protein [Dehalococcoidia bacterium]
MRALLPRVLRLLLTGKKGPFVFDRQQVQWPARPASLNIYIHLPFCRQLCAFCPYLKEVYDPSLSAAYQQALLKELESYRRLWGDINIESVYFGGGTPSLTPGIVEETLSWIAGNFRLGGEVGAEIHPRDATPSLLGALRKSGVNLASLGVQSFNDRLLSLLGRDYDSKLARQACQRLMEAGFATADIDLIFAIPTQNKEEAEADIAAACSLNADQISVYPLLAFSYTPLRQQLHKDGLSLPPWWRERQMLGAIVKKARDAGYQRTSIWSFNKPETLRYTTVTRDAFIGIGAGASSRIGDYFKLNTFSVAEYIRAAGEGSPLALATRLDASDKMAYWLFWRGYDLAIDTSAFRSIFGQGLPYRLRALLSLLRLLGITYRKENTIHLTDRGAYLFHLIEKEYTHAYLETLWNACMEEPWPQRVVI